MLEVKVDNCTIKQEYSEGFSIYKYTYKVYDSAGAVMKSFNSFKLAKQYLNKLYICE